MEEGVGIVSLEPVEGAGERKESAGGFGLGNAFSEEPNRLRVPNL